MFNKTYKVQLMMDNGQSKIIIVNENSETDVLNNLLMTDKLGPPANKFNTVQTREGTSFVYCVGKLSTIEILY